MKINNKLISICIPTFKQSDSLKILFRSIAEQTFQPYEIIVSDDSDDDSVKELCAQTDLPIKYYKNLPALGSPENWNFAIAKATGNWIKLIHHDDYFYDSSSLANFIGEVEKFPETDYFFCGTSILDTHSGNQYPYNVDNKRINKIGDFSAYLFHRNLIGAPSTGFFKKTLIETYDKSLIWLVDIEFYCRILDANLVRRIDSALITTTISDNQLTTKLKNNRAVELNEFIYCYNKLIGNFNGINRKIMRHRMIDLFKEFQISSIADLKSTGLKNGVPTYAKLFFFVFRLNPKFAFRLFYKLNHFEIP